VETDAEEADQTRQTDADEADEADEADQPDTASPPPPHTQDIDEVIIIEDSGDAEVCHQVRRRYLGVAGPDVKMRVVKMRVLCNEHQLGQMRSLGYHHPSHASLACIPPMHPSRRT